MDIYKNIEAASDSVKNKIHEIKLKTIQMFSGLKSVLENIIIKDAGAATHGGVASTDGRVIELNMDGAEEITPEILAHEGKHIDDGDPKKSVEDPWLFNIAADAVINEGLNIKHGVKIPNAKSYGKQGLYNILLKLKNYITADELSSAPGEQQFTREEFHAAIFGNSILWEKALRYLEQKENQKEQPKQEPKQEPKQQEQEPKRRHVDNKKFSFPVKSKRKEESQQEEPVMAM